MSISDLRQDMRMDMTSLVMNDIANHWLEMYHPQETNSLLDSSDSPGYEWKPRLIVCLFAELVSCKEG